MKDTIVRLLVIHAAVLALTALGAAFVWGPFGVVSAVAGVLSFSLPVVALSGLVLKASQGEGGRFWGRFLAAEALKWLGATVLLTVAFVVGVFRPVALLVGFVFSVLSQVLFPIFVPKGNPS